MTNQTELKKEAEQYLSRMKVKYQTDTRDWERFANEVPDKFMQLVKSGIKPSISRGDSGYSGGTGRTLSVSLSFETNMDAAKEYLESLKEEIPRRGKAFAKVIDDFDARLQKYYDAGLEGESLEKLAKHFGQWVDYAKNLHVQIRDSKISVELPAKYIAKKKQWLELADKQKLEEDAVRYGIPVADVPKHRKYLEARQKKAMAKTSAAMNQAIKLLQELGGYQDTQNLILEAKKTAGQMREREMELERIRKAEEEKRRKEEEERKEAERKEKSYNEALQHMQSNNEKTVAKALSALRALKDYRDAEALAAECVKKLEAIEEEKEKARQEAARKAEEERKRREAEERQRRLEEEARRKREEEARIAAEKAAAEKRAAEEAAARERAEQKRKKKERFLKKLKRTLITLLVIALVLGTIAVLTPTVILPAVEKARDYQSAQQYLEVGRYDEAEAKFRSLGTYKDSADLVFVARYQKAEYLLETRQYPEAIALWQELGSYMDSAQRAADALVQWREPDYSAALAQMEQGLYLAAADLFSTLEGYKDSAEKAEECKALHTEQLYLQAQEAMESGAYPEAMEIYKQLGDYRDSRQLYQTCAYEHAVALLAAKEYVDASAYFTLASGYRDAAQLRKEADYQHGIQLLTAGKYADAINQLGKCKGYSNADKKIMDAKYGYVQANFSRDNKTTQNYLKELIAAKYNGAQKLYDELYAWKVEIIAFNNTPYNHTSQNTVSKYQGMYCHFKVTGGEPGTTINLKVKVTAPNGQSGTIHFNSCSDGSIWSTRFSYDNPYYGATGTMSVVIYDAATNRKMDSGSVQVTN